MGCVKEKEKQKKKKANAFTPSTRCLFLKLTKRMKKNRVQKNTQRRTASFFLIFIFFFPKHHQKSNNVFHTTYDIE